MRNCLKFFPAIFLLMPPTALASISDCIGVHRAPMPLISEIYAIARPSCYTAAFTAALLIVIYKCFRGKVSQQYSIVYIFAAPIIYFLIRYKLLQYMPYQFVYPVPRSCQWYYAYDERFIYAAVLGVLSLGGTFLFFKGEKLDGQKFERYQNWILFGLAVIVAYGSGASYRAF